jgi:hypothetical protein
VLQACDAGGVARDHGGHVPLSTSACTLGEFLAVGMVELTYQAIVRSRPTRRRIALGVRSSTDPRPIVTDDAR